MRACSTRQELRADAAAGGARGNSRLHLHPRRHLQRSGHALRASGHHHRSALTTLACGDRISRSARRLAESKPVAGKIGGRSTCFDARASSPEQCLARTDAAIATVDSVDTVCAPSHRSPSVSRKLELRRAKMFAHILHNSHLCVCASHPHNCRLECATLPTAVNQTVKAPNTH